MSVDFTSEQRWDPNAADLIPVGKWLTVIAEAKTGKSSGGYSQIELRLERPDGSNLRDWIVITPATTGKVIQLVEAAGLENPGQINADDPDDPDWTAYVAQFVGKTVGIKVDDEPRNDDPSRTRRRVQAYFTQEEIKLTADSDVPPDTTGLGVQSSQAEDPDIPF